MKPPLVLDAERVQVPAYLLLQLVDGLQHLLLQRDQRLPALFDLGRLLVNCLPVLHALRQSFVQRRAV
jgi:hypothetical protein